MRFVRYRGVGAEALGILDAGGKTLRRWNSLRVRLWRYERADPKAGPSSGGALEALRGEKPRRQGFCPWPKWSCWPPSGARCTTFCAWE